MNAARFAEFWRIQGHKVIETKSCYWYNSRRFFFMSLPYHRVITPSIQEMATVLLTGPSVGLRFPTALDGTGKVNGLYVCSDPNYDFHTLQPRTRTTTRRGLENCAVKQVGFDYLAEHGHAVNVDMFLRQGRDPELLTEREWYRYCKAASEIPDFEAWSAYVGDRLAAFMVTALVEDCFSILHQSSRTDDLQYYPNNALVFTVTKLKQSSPQVGYVSYGPKSLEDLPGLVRFKRQMGFELQPFKQGIVFNPLLKPFLYLGGHKLIKRMARQHPESDLWRKAAGALR